MQAPAYALLIKLTRDPNVPGNSRVTSLLQLKKIYNKIVKNIGGHYHARSKFVFL